MKENQIIIRFCAVCGDKAITKNFCAISCESCKAFFRRNASKIDEFNCIYGNDCQINLDTRKRCRKCRLKKCFKVGMRKEWILNEEEKRIRNNKIEENRKKKLQNQNIANDMPSPLTTSKESSNQTNSSNALEDIPINTVVSHRSEGTQNDLNENQSNCCTELVPIVRPLTDYNNNFTETEGKVFSELLNATKFLTILVSDMNSVIKTHCEAIGVISYKWDEEIRKIIKTAKSLTAFKDICEDDRISLIKNSSVEISLMRSVICYELQNEYWIVALDTNNATKIDLEVFKQSSIEEYKQLKICINTLAHLWEFDHIILHLLMAIVLFIPIRPHIKHKSQIRLKQQIYIHLLKRYLQLKYGSETESESRLSKLMDGISNLHNFHENHFRQYVNNDKTKHIFFSNYPLLKELYDKNNENTIESQFFGHNL